MKQKTFLFKISLFFSILLFLTIINKGFVKEIYAWDDCPKGLTNDAYPGSCPQYIDTDENGICDHSEPAPEDRIDKASSEPNSTKQINTSKTSAPNNTQTILAVIIPLAALVGYMSLKKLKVNKRI